MSLWRRLSSAVTAGFGRGPRLDVVQVAVTTRCNAACVYCPRTVYARQWVNRDLDPAMFRDMLPALAGARHIHLQGWGEPFLHPHLVDFIRQAKAAGLRVSTTTNAANLDPALLEEAVDAGLDDIGLSLAGVTPEENDPIRKGAPFDGVVRTAALVNELAKKRGGHGPTLHLAYIVLGSHTERVFALPALMARLEISEGVVSALGFVPSWLLEEEESLLPRTRNDAKAVREFRRALFKLSMAAAFQGIDLSYQIPSLKRRRICPENVRSSLVVNADGGVSPCVMGHMPVKGNCYHWYAGEEHLFIPLVFGELASDPAGQLEAITSGSARGRFLGTFGSRRPSPSCLQCVKLHMESE